jgi:poly-gamma-glutamate synthesis protein (capsule biosynthesis protein)
LSNQTGSIIVAATGDSLITRKILTHKKCEQVAEIIRNADVGFTNCEMVFHECESYPMPKSAGSGANMFAEPFLAKELASTGFNITSLCNNHTGDYGPYGIFSTMKALEDAGVVHAGSGRDLYEAREPKYLETEKGRVALVASCWDPWMERWERASIMRDGIPARPGVNLLRAETKYNLSKESFDVLVKTLSELGLNDDNQNQLTVLRNKFSYGSKIGINTTINHNDLEENIRSVKDAKRSADWVLASFHSEVVESRGKEYPPEFMCNYARELINAGADAFIGHGPHILRGIEIYKRRPIFYSLGNFIAGHYTLKKESYDHYEYLGLDDRARPSDLREIPMGGKRTPPKPPYGEWRFSSVFAVFELSGEGLIELKLYPLSLGLGEVQPSHLGYPEIAENKQAQEITERIQKISAQWGTKIALENGVWKVTL